MWFGVVDYTDVLKASMAIANKEGDTDDVVAYVVNGSQNAVKFHRSSITRLM